MCQCSITCRLMFNDAHGYNCVHVNVKKLHVVIVGYRLC